MPPSSRRPRTNRPRRRRSPNSPRRRARRLERRWSPSRQPRQTEAPASPRSCGATAPAKDNPAAKDSGKDAVAPATPASPAVATEQVAAPDPMASLDPADRADRGKDSRSARRQGRQDFRQQEGARRRRDVLSEPQSGAALVRQRRRERARQSRDRAAQGRRCRRPRSRTITRFRILPGIERGGAGRGRAEAHARPCSPMRAIVQAGRFPYSRVSDNIELPQAPPDTAAGARQARRGADAGKALEEFSPPHEAYQQAQGDARARCAASRRARRKIAGRAGAQAQPQGADGGCARAAAARAASASPARRPICATTPSSRKR